MQHNQDWTIFLRDLRTVFGVACATTMFQRCTFSVACTFSVCVEPFYLGGECPAGDLLSITFFELDINFLCKTMLVPISYWLYVNGLQNLFASCNLLSCERQLQLKVLKTNKWSNKNESQHHIKKSAHVPFLLCHGSFPSSLAA